MSKIFDRFNKAAKDGSFQEWLKNNPDGDPKANAFLLSTANQIKATESAKPKED